MAQFARFALTLMVGVLTRPNNSAPLTVALLSASLYSLILGWLSFGPLPRRETRSPLEKANDWRVNSGGSFSAAARSEEHTSELQSRSDLVCRLLLEKK